MKSLAICILLCIAVAAASKFVAEPIVPLKDLIESESRIISGQPAKLGQFPYQVANTISMSGGRGFCGAALICDSWVLTAAHCAKSATLFSLTLGSVNHTQAVEAGRIKIDSRKAIVHERFNSLTLNNDVALIRLPTKVNFTANIQPIPISRRHIGACKTLTVSGWGSTRNGGKVSLVLNFVNLRSISNEECERVYGISVVRNSTICCKRSQQHSTCNGDSGGPLVAKNAKGKYELVGVVSFVHAAGCASGNPSGYVRTESMLSWIERKINGTCKLNIPLVRAKICSLKAKKSILFGFK